MTPYVVRAVAQKELSRPDDGFAPHPIPQSTLLGRINRIYGVAARVDPSAPESRAISASSLIETEAVHRVGTRTER